MWKVYEREKFLVSHINCVGSAVQTVERRVKEVKPSLDELLLAPVDVLRKISRTILYTFLKSCYTHHRCNVSI